MRESQPERFDFVDCLRAIAILGVITIHSGVGRAFPDFLSPLFDSGARGVQLFFVLSAFTLMHSWESRRSNVAEFFVRRVFRIFPMYYLGIAYSLLVLGFAPRFWAPEGIGAADVALNLLFLHSFRINSFTSVVEGGWSIGAEMAFYAIFPLVAVRIATVRRAALLFAGASIGAYAFGELMRMWLKYRFGADYWYGPQGHVAQFFIVANPAFQLPCFAAGILAFRVWADFRSAPPSHWTRRHRATAGLIALSLAASLWLLFSLRSLGRIPWSAAWATCFFALLFGVMWLRPAILVNAASVWVGKVSYSMYLTHLIGLGCAGWIFAALGFEADRGTSSVLILTTVVGLAITVAMSSLTYVAIERPFIALGGRIARARHAAPRRALVAE